MQEKRSEHVPSLCLSLEFLNGLLIPVEGIFAVTIESTRTVIILVDIDEAITLLHFAGGRRYQIDRTPHQITEAVHLVFFNRQLDLFDVIPQIRDAVRIMDRLIFFQLVISTQAVFG